MSARFQGGLFGRVRRLPGRAGRPFCRLVRQAVWRARRRLGWYPYHDIKLRPKVVERIIREAGAQEWYIDAFRNRLDRPEMISTMEWIATHVDRRTRIFETGCGAAANLIWLGQHGFVFLSGSDVSAEAIAAARRLIALAGLPITLAQDDSLEPRLPIAPMGLLLALNWVYLCDDFKLGRFLTLYRERLVPGGFVVLDMVDVAFDRMPDNQYLTNDWSLPAECRRPTQYKIRMARDEVMQTAAAAGFGVVTMLPASEVPPRFLTVLQRR